MNFPNTISAHTVQLIETGARVYITGNTYPIKDRLRAAGAHWDKDYHTGAQRPGAWWIGKTKREVIDSLLAKQSAKPVAPATAPTGNHYTKLSSGAWGVRIKSESAPRHYSEVVVRTKDGKEKQETITSVLKSEDGWHTCQIQQRSPRAPRGFGGGCRCARPIDEGDGECMLCGYMMR